MTYREEFIHFMVRSGVLTFGDFTTKSGRKTPYFVNTGNYKTGAQASRLGDYYAACIQENLPDGIDWVTCSPKENAPVVLERIDEIKVVYTGQDLSAYAEMPARYHFLQPCSCRNTEEVVDYILRHPRWRLSLQTHKLIDIR